VLSTLNDFDDWSHLVIDMTLNGDEEGAPPPSEPIDCLPPPMEMESP